MLQASVRGCRIPHAILQIWGNNLSHTTHMCLAAEAVVVIHAGLHNLTGDRVTSPEFPHDAAGLPAHIHLGHILGIRGDALGPFSIFRSRILTPTRRKEHCCRHHRRHRCGHQPHPQGLLPFAPPILAPRQRRKLSRSRLLGLHYAGGSSENFTCGKRGGCRPA